MNLSFNARWYSLTVETSREVPISLLPMATNAIIDICLKRRIPYVATNVLDSMIKNPLPSRAEISDLYNLINRGVSGVVLAAEVAIGRHPIQCVQTVRRMSSLNFMGKPELANIVEMATTSFDISLATWL